MMHYLTTPITLEVGFLSSKILASTDCNIPDSPETIREHLDGVFTSPLLLNINTIRKYWHSGAGIDDDDVFDRYEYEMDRVDNGKEIHEKYKQNVEKLWKIS